MQQSVIKQSRACMAARRHIHYSKIGAESVDVIHVLYGYMSRKHAFGSVCVGFTRFH